VTVVGLLLAAGSGERLGARRPKAFVDCAGRPLLEWSLDALRAGCDRVVVAVPPALASGERDRVAGAACRSGSVRAALQAAPEAKVAIVHDAARPLVTPGLVERCLAALEEGWDGAVAAAPLSDTVKETGPGETRVVRTLPRRGLWAVQTPQVFRADVLRSALEADEPTLAAASDDASLVEAAGGAVRVVEAPAENLKVTSRLDLLVAEALLRERVSGAWAGSSSSPPAAGAGPSSPPPAATAQA
jgi:2-C-methyl-D-erythritol 4-phosphate cytidylyltransferase